MEDNNLEGKLVYLTVHYDRWLRDITANFNVPMANRLAKVIKVFDWNTKEGKILLEARKKTGKWDNLDPKAFKFVLQIYYPEIISGNKKGITIEEVCSRKYPGTDFNLFEIIPDWMVTSIRSDEYIKLSLESNKGSGVKSSVKKTSVKSSSKIKRKI